MKNEIVKPLGQPLLKEDLHRLTTLTRRHLETATATASSRLKAYLMAKSWSHLLK